MQSSPAPRWSEDGLTSCEIDEGLQSLGPDLAAVQRLPEPPGVLIGRSAADSRARRRTQRARQNQPTRPEPATEVHRLSRAASDVPLFSTGERRPFGLVRGLGQAKILRAGRGGCSPCTDCPGAGHRFMMKGRDEIEAKEAEIG